MNIRHFVGSHMQLSVPSEVMRAIQGDPRKCILFVGAGLSRSQVRERGRGLPDWHTLTRHMIQSLQDSQRCDPETCTRLWKSLANQDFLEIAQVFKQRTRPDAFALFLREELEPEDLVPSKIHETIVKTEFRGLITTNFDTVLEFHSDRTRRRLEVLIYPQFLDDPHTIRKERFLAKIHGCVCKTPNPAENLILTKESYLKLRSDRRYQAVMNSWLLGYTILTVGFSLRDPDFVGLLDDLREIFGTSLPTIYALMKEPEAREREEWRDKGVELIKYESHRQLCGFFLELLELSEKRYPSVKLGTSLLFPHRVSDVKKQAWRFYSEWRREGSISPRFGKVEITLKAWRHIASRSRPQSEVCHKLSLLPCARELINLTHESVMVRTIVERPVIWHGAVRQISTELHALRAPRESRFQADINVEVILEVTKEYGAVIGTKFLSVCERRA